MKEVEKVKWNSQLVAILGFYIYFFLFLKWKSRASLNRIPWHFDLSPAFIFAAAEHRIRFFGRLHAFKNLQLKATIVQF